MDGTAELRRKICQGFDLAMTVTNIRMEMTAVAAALEAILWHRIIASAEGKTVYWLRVKGHAGDERNERADRLANDEMHKAVAAAFAQAA